MNAMSDGLPKELTHLVDVATATLGRAIKEDAGEEVYSRIESIRVRSKALRSGDIEATASQLEEFHREFLQLNSHQRIQVAHGFSLMLELFNVCENSYRTFRLGTRPEQVSPTQIDSVTYVLTAHPTEARSYESIRLFAQIQTVLVESLRRGQHRLELKLLPLLKMAWKIPMAKTSVPTVEQEATHLYAASLGRESIEALIRSHLDGTSVFLRTWVGGDKDGHPGVDEVALRLSLQASRKYIVTHLKRLLSQIEKNLHLLVAGKDRVSTESRALLDELHKHSKGVKALSEISDGDGARVLAVTVGLRALCERYNHLVGSPSFNSARVESLISIFPGLVMPLELRENADVIENAEGNDDLPISKMLSALAKISNGGEPKWYARGLVISMVDQSEDLISAANIVCAKLGKTSFSIVPLLEKESALRNAVGIVTGFMNSPVGKELVEGYWNHHLEVMLGYSDSAKEVGSLPSRLLIGNAMGEIESALKAKGVEPVFFHGSGGSVARGGGSIEEQIRWWPRSALKRYKVTIQGEMVQRSFASGEIIRSQLRKISSISSKLLGEHRSTIVPSPSLEKLAELVKASYQEFTQSDFFVTLLEGVTLYPFLKDLRLGSRPAKRSSGEFSLSSIRAIPWVLCWTQARVLFPAWWGVGSAWTSLSQSEKEELQQGFLENELFRSYVHVLGFTLSKVELGVWKFLVDHSNFEPSKKAELIGSFQGEFQQARTFVQEISGQTGLLWFRPWLKSSIEKRSSMIHCLNVLQTIAISENDSALLGECTTGVACGMLTTG